MRRIRVLVSALTLQSALLLLRGQSPVIYSFGGDPDGANPKRSVTLSGSSLYGTTVYGGSGDGTVFQLLSSSGSWSETVLYSFAGGSGDGSEPDGNLVISGSSLYGTTSEGGTAGLGTVFRLKDTSGTWTESVIYNFAGGTGDGSYPYAGLLLSGGVFYGTTYYGGTYGAGTVFSLSASGNTWTETVIYNFGGTGDGANPHAPLTVSSGVLYGTTYNGGASGDGTVFSLTPSGGSWTEAVLYSFSGTDGQNPHGGVVVGGGGVLYGTTLQGGSSSDGTAFSLTPPVSPSTTWTQTVLHNSTGGTSEGAELRSGVVIGGSGVLYGVTVAGGPSGEGTIYSLTPPTPPSTTWTEAILYNFTGSGGDGAQPYADLLYSSGWLYGTTYSGGSSSDGTVFAWEL